jgi:hypothetical protein
MPERRCTLFLAACTALMLAVPAAVADPPATLDKAHAELRAGRPAEAARLLKTLDSKTLAPKEQERWRMLARVAGVRTADRDLLRQANRFPDRFSFVPENHIITAADYLRTALYSQARRELRDIADPDALPARSRIRYHAVAARLERIAGTREAERDALRRVVESLGAFAKTVASGEPFAYADWWVGKRLSAVLTPAEAQQLYTTATKRLQTSPDDVAARLLLGCALRTIGKTEEAQSAFASLPPLPLKAANAPRLTDLTQFP